MRAVITFLFGVALVMYVANGISIGQGKGNNTTCLVFGILATGAALALWIENGTRHKSK